MQWAFYEQMVNICSEVGIGPEETAAFEPITLTAAQLENDASLQV